jgi:hypothetical protein
VRAVRLDGPDREGEAAGDLVVRVPERDQPQDLELAQRQLAASPGRPGPGGGVAEPRGDIRLPRGRRPHRFDELLVGRTP